MHSGIRPNHGIAQHLGDESGTKISCHSENGSVIDLDTQLAVWESGAEIYTRGLAATQDYVLIGESQKTGRDLRRSSLGGIWILDRKSWKPVDHIYLGPYGAVNESRVLDVADDAHHEHATLIWLVCSLVIATRNCPGLACPPQLRPRRAGDMV